MIYVILVVLKYLVLLSILFFPGLLEYWMFSSLGIRIWSVNIGFGPAVMSWRDERGTEWTIRFFPGPWRQSVNRREFPITEHLTLAKGDVSDGEYVFLTHAGNHEVFKDGQVVRNGGRYLLGTWRIALSEISESGHPFSTKAIEDMPFFWWIVPFFVRPVACSGFAVVFFAIALASGFDVSATRNQMWEASFHASQFLEEATIQKITDGRESEMVVLGVTVGGAADRSGIVPGDTVLPGELSVYDATTDAGVYMNSIRSSDANEWTMVIRHSPEAVAIPIVLRPDRLIDSETWVFDTFGIKFGVRQHVVVPFAPAMAIATGETMFIGTALIMGPIHRVVTLIQRLVAPEEDVRAPVEQHYVKTQSSPVAMDDFAKRWQECGYFAVVLALLCFAPISGWGGGEILKSVLRKIVGRLPQYMTIERVIFWVLFAVSVPMTIAVVVMIIMS